MAFGATGHCKNKKGNPHYIITDWNECYIIKRSEKSNTKPDNKKSIQCGNCKHFKRVQDPAIINSPLKERCVYNCEHYTGFHRDHKDWIDCNVINSSTRYFADTPHSLGERMTDKRWIGFCKDFIQKQIKSKPLLKRFEDLDIV
jgi:hypothetical protein